jgi:protein-disulfide isomerase
MQILTPWHRRRSSLSVVTDALALCLIVGAGVTLLTRETTHDHEEPEVVTDLPRNTAFSLDGLPTLGDANASVVMVEFSDYLCRFCRRFAQDTLPRIRQQLIDAGKLTYAFVHAPGAAQNPLSSDLSKAAICAGQQGLFWQAHDTLYESSAPDLPSALTALQRVGVDAAAQSQCLQGAWARTVLDRELQARSRLGVTGTPTFLVGRRANGTITWLRRIKGSQPFSVFSRVVAETGSRPFWRW